MVIVYRVGRYGFVGMLSRFRRYRAEWRQTDCKTAGKGSGLRDAGETALCGRC